MKENTWNVLESEGVFNKFYLQNLEISNMYCLWNDSFFKGFVLGLFGLKYLNKC